MAPRKCKTALNKSLYPTTRRNIRATIPPSTQKLNSTSLITQRKRAVSPTENKNAQGLDNLPPSREKAKAHVRKDNVALPSDEDISSKDMNPNLENTDYEVSVPCSSETLTPSSRNGSDALSNLPQRLRLRRRQMEIFRKQSGLNSTGSSAVPEERRNNSSASSQNQLKVELSEAIRDKRAYASAFLTMKDQTFILEKDLLKLKKDNLALQTSLVRTRTGTRGRKPVWSQENLKGTSIEAFQGICLAAGAVAKREAVYITTETYWDEPDQIRIRNWNGATCVTLPEVASKLPLNILLPNGTLGAPDCCMKRCLEGEEYSLGIKTPKQFASHCVEKVLQGPIGCAMPPLERAQCTSKIIAHKQTVQKFRAILSDSVGNRKKAAFQIYLRTLGYRYGAKPNSKHSTNDERSSRLFERERIHGRVIMASEGDEINTMNWRFFSRSRLCNSNSSTMEETSDVPCNNDEGFVDHLFMNNAAKRVFLCLRGYSVPTIQKPYLSDVSIVCLARADAYMKTMVKWIKVGGKGGVRNCEIRDCFWDMFPMSNIIQDIWDDIKTITPQEMYPYIGNSAECAGDSFGNDRREWTTVLDHPGDNCLYLVARPGYFSQMVCSWYGNVKDCHIGHCSKNGTTFTRIEPHTDLTEVEESDLEDQEGELEIKNGNVNELIQSYLHDMVCDNVSMEI